MGDSDALPAPAGDEVILMSQSGFGFVDLRFHPAEVKIRRVDFLAGVLLVGVPLGEREGRRVLLHVLGLPELVSVSVTLFAGGTVLCEAATGQEQDDYYSDDAQKDDAINGE